MERLLDGLAEMDWNVFSHSAGQLIAHGPVDEYRPTIEPILPGGGKRSLPDDGSARTLELSRRRRPLLASSSALTVRSTAG